MNINTQDLNLWDTGHEGEVAGEGSFQVSGLGDCINSGCINSDTIHRRRPRCVCLGAVKRFVWKLSLSYISAMLTQRWDF